MGKKGSFTINNNDTVASNTSVTVAYSNKSYDQEEDGSKVTMNGVTVNEEKTPVSGNYFHCNQTEIAFVAKFMGSFCFKHFKIKSYGFSQNHPREIIIPTDKTAEKAVWMSICL